MQHFWNAGFHASGREDMYVFRLSYCKFPSLETSVDISSYPLTTYLLIPTYYVVSLYNDNNLKMAHEYCVSTRTVCKQATQ